MMRDGDHKTANQRRDQSTEPMLANQEAEAALLGAMMLDNSVIDLITPIVRREDFFWQPHGDIFRSIIRLAANGEKATPVSLKPIFDGDIRLHPVGGVGYLAKLTGSGASLLGFDTFAQQIADLATMRRSREALYEGIEQLEDIRNEWPDPAAIAAALDTRLREAGTAKAAVKVRDLGSMTHTVLNRVHRAQESSVGYHNKWITDLNHALGELEGKTYNVLAGRPGMGKTVMACSTSLGYAAGGNPWLCLHGEMSDEQMDLRVICDMAFALGHRISIDKIRKGELTEAERLVIARIEEMKDLMPIEFIATGACDISLVGSHVRRAKAKWEAKGRKLAGFTLDYMQLYTAESIIGGAAADERRNVNAVSKYLRKLIDDNALAGIVLSQLTRKVEDRPRAIPQISDLRESGKIEEDADSVMLLWREEYYLERMDPPTKTKEFEDHEAALAASRNKCELLVPKNRHGKATKRVMQFHGDYQAMRSGNHTEYMEGNAMFSKQHELFEEPL